MRRRDPPGDKAETGRSADHADGGRFRNALRHPLAITAAGALVAGWLLPPFAHQWQDRQKERDLKRELATQLDRDITTALISAQLLLTRQFPEAQTAIVRKRERDDASSGPRREELSAQYEAASEREREAGTRAFVRGASAWFVTRSVSISTLTAYFPEDDLPEKWREYTNRVTYYLHLGSSRVRPEVRRARLDNLIGYLGVDDDEGDKWLLLVRPSAEVPAKELGPYQEAAGRLAESLLKRKNAFVAEILAAHAEGFSTEPSDLIEELLPFLN